MAAMRSALVMLSRRSCGSFGSSAPASMGGGRGLQVHQAFRSTTPSLRPCAGNLEGWRHFSAGAGEPEKTGSFLQMSWQRFRDRLRNASELEKENMNLAYAVVLLGLGSCHAIMTFRDIRPRPRKVAGLHSE